MLLQACRPVTTMSNRNDLLALAHERLDLSTFDALYTCKPAATPGRLNSGATEAEQLAWHSLSEGTGSVWTSVRAVVALLAFEKDGRKFSDGFILILAMLSKCGAHGFTRHTHANANVCRLLNRMVRGVCPHLRWSSITPTLDNRCKHLDMGQLLRWKVLLCPLALVLIILLRQQRLLLLLRML